MKKILLITACSLYAFATRAQGYIPMTPHAKSEIVYCISSAGGKMIVTSNEKTVTDPVKFITGATLTSDGNIIWKDKSETRLKNGYCIDESGAVLTPGIVATETKAKEVVVVDHSVRRF